MSKLATNERPTRPLPCGTCTDTDMSTDISTGTGAGTAIATAPIRCGALGYIDPMPREPGLP